MRIAVIAPHAEHNGKTVLSILIGMELSQSRNKTLMCHTESISTSTFDYLSLNEFNDKTSTPSQIVKILREGDMDPESYSDYCKNITDNFEVFTNNSTNFTQDDMSYMLNYIVDGFPHEHVIVDMNNENTEFNKKIISKCDVVVLCINQDKEEARKFKDNKDDIVDLLQDKPLITIVNKYNSSKGTLQELANWMGLKKPNKWLVLHENPWICWATNHGKIETLFKLIGKKDERVSELNGELNKIVISIIRAKTTTDKKKGGQR